MDFTKPPHLPNLNIFLPPHPPNVLSSNLSTCPALCLYVAWIRKLPKGAIAAAATVKESHGLHSVGARPCHDRHLTFVREYPGITFGTTNIVPTGTHSPNHQNGRSTRGRLPFPYPGPRQRLTQYTSSCMADPRKASSYGAGLSGLLGGLAFATS